MLLKDFLERLALSLHLIPDSVLYLRRDPWDVGSHHWDMGSQHWDVGYHQWNVGFHPWDVGSLGTPEQALDAFDIGCDPCTTTASHREQEHSGT